MPTMPDRLPDGSTPQTFLDAVKTMFEKKQRRKPPHQRDPEPDPDDQDIPEDENETW